MPVSVAVPSALGSVAVPSVALASIEPVGSPAGPPSADDGAVVMPPLVPSVSPPSPPGSDLPLHPRTSASPRLAHSWVAKLLCIPH